jgi:phosphoglycolate phosphatase-like HAD superfamily hydrolase
MFNNLVLRSIIESQSEGTDFRADLTAELEMIDQIEKDLKALKQARRELAVEAGYAEFKEVTIKEHIRKEHSQQRFYWLRTEPAAEPNPWTLAHAIAKNLAKK